ncbi:MAG TPA: hypothetical protein VIL20_26410 [Sandaracinaceae bacterium]
MSSPFSVPGAKPTLALALTMTLFGIVGVSSSLNALTASPSEVAVAGPGVAPELTEVTAAIAREPLWRAVGVANLLVSGLLLVASFLMTGRARSALWWTGQALWANAAYSLGAGAANAYLVHVHAGELIRAVEAMAAMDPASPPLPPGAADGMPLLASVAALVYGAFLAGLYLVMLRVARADAVQRFVQRVPPAT